MNHYCAPSIYLKRAEQKIRINDIYQSLHGYLVSPRLTPEKAVELYCFINKKWGVIEYDENGRNPIVTIKDLYK